MLAKGRVRQNDTPKEWSYFLLFGKECWQPSDGEKINGDVNQLIHFNFFAILMKIDFFNYSCIN